MPHLDSRQSFSRSSVTLGYDALNRLTNIVDGVGTTAYSYAMLGNGLRTMTEDDPWASDEITVTNRGRLRRISAKHLGWGKNLTIRVVQTSAHYMFIDCGGRTWEESASFRLAALLLR